MSTHWVNIVIAVSSLLGIIPISAAYEKRNQFGLWLSLAVTISSVLQHLSENKHGLTPVILKNHSYALLNADRFFAGVSFLYGAYRWIYYPTDITMHDIIAFIMTAICMEISELVVPDDLLFFILVHPFWHFIAFVVLSKAF